MTAEISLRTEHPTDAKTGLTLPLSKSLGSQELARHRAMVGLELEVMAKKMDRFGWERDRDTLAHDRIVSDWMDALCDFPLDEVQTACRKWIEENPRKMPNEGDIKSLIIRARSRHVHSLGLPKQSPKPEPERCSPQAARKILQDAGFSPDRFPTNRKD